MAISARSDSPWWPQRVTLPVAPLVIRGTSFNGGVRSFDLSDPFRPQEVAWFVPSAPRKSPAKAIQINHVMVDERKLVYAVDRLVGGLYILKVKV